MFKKKPNIKPLSPIRSSDRRKIAEQIISDWKLEKPLEDGADEATKAAAAAAHIALRNSLVPENSQSARFMSTIGPELSPISGTIYVGSHKGAEPRVLWFKYKDRMYPTVYTLWQNPKIIPLLHTPDIVVEKIQGGASLMTPGLAGPPFPSNATKGSIVAIASWDTPSVPMAVGTCVIDVSILTRVQGTKGHAVEPVHWYGDELWDWSPNGIPGKKSPEELESWLQEEDTADGVTQLTEELELEDTDGGVPLTDEQNDGNNGEAPEPGRQEDDEGEEPDDAPRRPQREYTTQEIDEVFRKAFVCGVHHYKRLNEGQSTYGLTFPLSATFTMSSLIQPFLPIFDEADANAFQIKKTSWKTLKKFINHLGKQNILLSKTFGGGSGETVILDIDFNDEAIVKFRPYSLPKKKKPNQEADGKAGSSSSGNQQLKLTTFYRPKSNISAIFPGETSKAFYTRSQLRHDLDAYITANALGDTKNPRLVKFDPVIASLFNGSNATDAKTLAAGGVPRDALATRLENSCNTFWALHPNSMAPDDVPTTIKPKAGTPPKVTIILEQRAGNKVVTRITGIEPYGIRAQSLADELRKLCASSTSVDQATGAKKGVEAFEVMVQGNQHRDVAKVLGKRGVRPEWITVTDRTKKSKSAGR
ncbi:hypothetical protein P152DRAFT_480727 [Eremomyces bilateralis CBS 781.70]|uniref:SUI1 domain-containing protein n=1 Tax=Eremomyces bilateralis CBS 781.70 TaxID=1392243 RepID=A0A6G1G944_9PEZI|nr:uncharacterized protein P152DRAFT_480727 [Eremomyces bilateralis CBS 781.70]KAF1814564.1 hypothetical protein P152DRAFT_480727 [Eremomyces bilateralis CBS 781.70]